MSLVAAEGGAALADLVTGRRRNERWSMEPLE